MHKSNSAELCRLVRRALFVGWMG